MCAWHALFKTMVQKFLFSAVARAHVNSARPTSTYHAVDRILFYPAHYGMLNTIPSSQAIQKKCFQTLPYILGQGGGQNHPQLRNTSSVRKALQ